MAKKIVPHTLTTCIQVEAIASITGSLASIHSELVKISQGGIAVEIKNGGGKPVIYQLPDIIQTFYDRRKMAEGVFNRIVVVARGLFWIIGAMITVVFAISKLFHA